MAKPRRSTGRWTAIAGLTRSSGTSLSNGSCPHSFYCRASRTWAPRETHLPSSLTPINILNPLDSAVTLPWVRSERRLQHSRRPRHFRCPRRQPALCRLGVATQPGQRRSLLGHPCPGPASLSAVLRSAAGTKRAARRVDLQLLPGHVRAAPHQRPLPARFAHGREALHRCLRYHPVHQ